MQAAASALLDRLEGRTVLVVGDVMLDEYIRGSVDRISPEAPVPVVDVGRTEFRLGGAANVTHNVLALGGRPILAGVIGDDGFGRKAVEALGAEGIRADGLVVDGQRPTTIKTRVIAGAQQIVRYDRESRAPLPEETASRVVAFATEVLDEVDAVVLSDYAKGVLGHGVGEKIIERFTAAGRPVLADPKIKNFGAFRGASVITPNYKEACEAAALHAGIHVDSDGDLETAARALVEKMKSDLVVTRGEAGMYVFTADGTTVHIPTAAREVYDVSGAGDTVISTLAMGLAAGATLPEAATLANHAAGVVVAKFGTATASVPEIRAHIERHPE